MTGELFNLLKEHSILADLLERRSSPATRSRAGVRRGLDGDALQADFLGPRRGCCSARPGGRMPRPTPAGC